MEDFFSQVNLSLALLFPLYAKQSETGDKCTITTFSELCSAIHAFYGLSFNVHTKKSRSTDHCNNAGLKNVWSRVPNNAFLSMYIVQYPGKMQYDLAKDPRKMYLVVVSVLFKTVFQLHYRPSICQDPALNVKNPHNAKFRQLILLSL